MKRARCAVALLPFVMTGGLLHGAGGCEGAGDFADAVCCKDFEVGADLSGVDFEADANFNALMQATADFAAVGTAVVNDVAAACQLLAVDLGEPEGSVNATDPAARVEAWCALAKARIEAEVLAKGEVRLSVQPARCTFSASAQASCEGKCEVAADCEAELTDVEARCEPGQLSVSCEGSCKGTCEGSANLAVTCEGVCEGTCEGTCDGTAMPGGASGKCDGKCEGKCRGSCQASADAELECEGSCSGECAGTATAPKCKVELGDPPRAECKAKGDCAASCEASASAKAECAPPAIEIDAAAGVSTKAVAALRLRLPALWMAVSRTDVLLVQVKVLIDAATRLDPGALSVKAAACAIPAGEAAGTALINLEASGKATLSIVSLFEQ